MLRCFLMVRRSQALATRLRRDLGDLAEQYLYIWLTIRQVSVVMVVVKR
jgi:hypothetical protein